MNTHTDKAREVTNQSVANALSQEKGNTESAVQFTDNRPEAVAQRKIRAMANNSTQLIQQSVYQEMANNSPQANQAAQLQAMADRKMAQQIPIQKKENNTGLPDNLKTGIESLSGVSLDDVKVHRNSDKPAQLQAHAYAQDKEIHLAQGQEKHLPHEAWHIVQQKQGRVKPTMQMKGKVNINDDTGLEEEADRMGAQALSVGSGNERTSHAPKNIHSGNDGLIQKKTGKPAQGNTVQLQAEEKDHSQEKEELLDLAGQLEESKPDIKAVPASEIDKAVNSLVTVANSGDLESTRKALTLVKQEETKAIETSQTPEAGTAPAQMSFWRIAGLLGGGLGGAVMGGGIGAGLGALIGFIPGIGNALGAIVGGIDGVVVGGIAGAVAGYRKGQYQDWRNDPAPGTFTIGNIWGASQSGGNYGSLYFNGGRIRLVHDSGPQVSIHAGITRFTISNADYANYKVWKRAAVRTNVQKHAYVTALPSCVPAVPGGGGQRLFEFFGANGINGNHPSRGGPVAFPLPGITQPQLNLIYHAANTNSNDTLRRAMNSDPVLAAAIPMN